MYEGIENESPKSKRHKLQEPYYFCRVCSGTDNDSFWDEIYEYISNKYDLTKVKRIYLNSDGGDMLELVRYQKKEIPKAAGAEYNILSSLEVIRSEKNRHGQLGKFRF